MVSPELSYQCSLYKSKYDSEYVDDNEAHVGCYDEGYAKALSDPRKYEIGKVPPYQYVLCQSEIDEVIKAAEQRGYEKAMNYINIHAYYVMEHCGEDELVELSVGFKDKEAAEKFMLSLNKKKHPSPAIYARILSTEENIRNNRFEKALKEFKVAHPNE